jgi:hypothetical protein
VVADVNGVPVTRRALDVLAAATVMNGGTDASGRPLTQLSRRELLDGIIDSILLAQAAEAAGVVVTDDDVSLMVKNSISGPLSDGNLPKDYQRFLESSLKAMGTTVEDAPRDPELRAAYRRFLLTQRYVTQSNKSRPDLVAVARASASIRIFDDVLNGGG